MPARPLTDVSSSFICRFWIDAALSLAARRPDSDTLVSAVGSAVSTGTSKRPIRLRSENWLTFSGPEARSADDQFSTVSEPAASMPSARSV